MDNMSGDLSPAPRKSQAGLIVTIIVIILLAAGGYFFFKNAQQNKKAATPLVPTQQPTVTEAPTSTPSASISPSPSVKPTSGAVKSAADMNIQVLNGSGTPGAATEVKDYLVSQGYKNVTTGNADNFDFEGVTINVKSADKQYLTALKTTLSNKYTITTTGTLASDSDFDATVTVGK